MSSEISKLAWKLFFQGHLLRSPSVSSKSHCLRVRCFFGPYFPVFGLNTEIYEVNLIAIFNPDAGKYGPEKFRERILFTQYCQLNNHCYHQKAVT